MADFLYTLIIYPLYTLIECAFVFFNKVTPHVGYAVIGISLAVTLLCLPLYAVAEKWQQVERDAQKKMKSQLDRIKATFTGDERYMMTTAYYKENHYSPIMALRSSFGLLIQIPFFIAAYSFLTHLPALQGSSFLFIRNMGAPDALFTIGSFPVNVLPIAMTLINIVAGAIYTKGFSFRDKAQIYGMALVFLVILYNSPAGLVLYWTMNNVFSLIKNIFYKLKNPAKAFWIFCCVLLVPVLFYIFIVADTQLPNKILFLALALLVYMIPLFLQVAKWLLKTKLAFLAESFKVRTWLFILSCLVLFILSGFAIPSTLIGSSPIEFTDLGLHPNPIFFICNTALQSAGIFLFWATCIYFLFGSTVQTMLALGMCVLSYIAVIDAYVFMLSYGDISATLIFLAAADFKLISPLSILNLISIALIIILIPLLLHIKRGKIISSLSTILIFSLSAISTANLYAIQSSYSNYKNNYAESEATSIEPMYHLSRNHENVVLFMLDMAQGQFVKEIMNEDPSLRDVFSGFTFYNNALSFNAHTLQGSPGIYGGYEYTPWEMNLRPETPMVDKHNEALLMLSRIFTEQKGYSAVITDPSWPNYKHFCDLSILEPYPAIKGYKAVGKYYSLWSQESEKNSIPDNTDSILKRNLLFFSLFRSSPIVLRNLIYKGGSYWNTDESAANGKAALDSYTALYYLNSLTSISDTENGTFSCIVNQLTHENDAMLFEAPDYTPAKEVKNLGTSKFRNDNSYHTQMASFKLIGKWIQYLKKEGIYDKTRIIIVSDHGGTDREDDMENDEMLDKAVSGGQYTGRAHYHCLFMYKDFNASGEISIDDHTFMTNADTPSLLLKGLIEKPVNPYTGKAIPLDTTSIKKDGVYISVSDAHQPVNNGEYTFSIKDNEWWHVKDNIFKAENWKQEKPVN
ncbi:MAG: YidC/Oxa1 family membrane protein insertase [Treponema sp.]|nr:YidC/Oxa1 family membrane protein insertase [Treponema sp.]